jgi:AraC-like DNA-binding protein
MLLLLIVTGYQLKAVIVLEGYYTSFPHLIKIFLPLHFLLGPLFFYYVKFTIGFQKQLKIKDAIHLIPFGVAFITLMPFYIKSGAEKLLMHSAPAPDNFHMNSSMIFYYGPMLFFAFFYYWKSLKILTSLKGGDGRGSKEYQNRLLWLEKYTKVFLFFLACFTVAQLIFVFTDFYQFYVMLLTVFASSILIHFVAYWAIKQSKIANHNTFDDKSYQTQEKAPDIKKGIIEILEVEKLYLDSNLSSKYLCDRLKVNSLYLSQVVNREFNCNISYLINSYRIEYAKKVLESGELNHLNFSGIAQKVGYNSANAFTRVFKQHTDQTPSEYKKQVQKK